MHNPAVVTIFEQSHVWGVPIIQETINIKETALTQTYPCATCCTIIIINLRTYYRCWSLIEAIGERVCYEIAWGRVGNSCCGK